MDKKLLKDLHDKYGIGRQHVHQHKHYTIVNRSGIELIKAKANITIEYDVVKCESDFACVKARGIMKDSIVEETFGSAKYGGKIKVGDKWVDQGTTTSRYIMEVAEKRAMSRVVLKLLGLYDKGFYGEDESEDFKYKSTNNE